jgi:hypothetical protein
MVRTISFGPMYGRVLQIWPFSGIGNINRFTNVVASITELGGPPGGPFDYPFIGNAVMRVLNVAPHDNGNVYVRTWINWNRYLPFRITFLVDP